MQQGAGQGRTWSIRPLILEAKLCNSYKTSKQVGGARYDSSRAFTLKF